MGLGCVTYLSMPHHPHQKRDKTNHHHPLKQDCQRVPEVMRGEQRCSEISISS